MLKQRSGIDYAEHCNQVNSGEVKEGELDIIGVECDVSSEISVQKAFGEVMDKFGKVNAVVASAGLSFPCQNYMKLVIHSLRRYR